MQCLREVDAPGDGGIVHPFRDRDGLAHGAVEMTRGVFVYVHGDERCESFLIIVVEFVGYAAGRHVAKR